MRLPDAGSVAVSGDIAASARDVVDVTRTSAVDGHVLADGAFAFDRDDVRDGAAHDEPSVADGDVERRRRRARGQSEAAQRRSFERRFDDELRLIERAGAGGLEHDVAAEEIADAGEQFELREIDRGRRDRVAELLVREIELRFAADLAGRRRTSTFVARMRPSVKTMSAEASSIGSPMTVPLRMVTLPLPFERFLAAGELQRAGEIAGHGHVAEVEERGDVGDREVRSRRCRDRS